MSYADTHLYRLGVNHHQIPVNQPVCPVHNYVRDGSLAGGQAGSAPNYWPNSHGETPMPDPTFADKAWALGQAVVDRFDSTKDHDDYTQAGNLYRLLDEGHRARLASRIAGGLTQSRPEVQQRMLGHFANADPCYSEQVEKELARLDR